ncbi:MAG: hypothetical protein PHS02_03825 [Candidatus ainarchaeum sp.]|nr:hypothetical protein [Candidatus ainarchaeum sp.]
MAKRKSKEHIIIRLLRFIYNLFKWFAFALWGVLLLLYRALVEGGKAYSEAQNERERPGKGPQYLPLEEIEKSQGSASGFESVLYSSKSAIGLVLGARGSGKSALGMRVAENMRAKTSQPIYAMGFEKKALPLWITHVQSLAEVKNRSFLLVDEGGIAFSSRNSMSGLNRLLSELLLISRHKDISVLFITQNSANIEVNTLRQVDYLLLKTPSLLQLDFERKKIKEIYEKAKDGFERHKYVQGLVFIYSDAFTGFASNPLPSFWSESLSKSYKKGAAGKI